MSALPMSDLAFQPSTPLRIRPVPVTDPPALTTPFVPADPRPQASLELGWDEQEHARPADERSALPDPRRTAATLAVAVIEVLNGTRPASQLVRWTSQDVQTALARRAAVNSRVARHPTTARPPIVKRVRVCEPSTGIAETSAVVVSPDRVRALAIRLEATEGRWRATALEVG